MNIRGQDYQITYDPTTMTITCEGLLRLQGAEGYTPIIKVLEDVVAQQPAVITLNLRKLEFINSSGINMFSKFVIRVRDCKSSKLIVQGTKTISWQSQSLRYFQRLLPALELDLA
jgi:hypothetical protein